MKCYGKRRDLRGHKKATTTRNISQQQRIWYKSGFSFLRQLTMWHYPQMQLRAVCCARCAAARLLLNRPAADRPCCNRSIFPGHRAHSSKPAERRAAVGWDRQTDGQTDVRRLHTPCSAYYADSANYRKYRPHPHVLNFKCSLMSVH